MKAKKKYEFDSNFSMTNYPLSIFDAIFHWNGLRARWVYLINIFFFQFIAVWASSSLLLTIIPEKKKIFLFALISISVLKILFNSFGTYSIHQNCVFYSMKIFYSRKLKRCEQYNFISVVETWRTTNALFGKYAKCCFIFSSRKYAVYFLSWYMIVYPIWKRILWNEIPVRNDNYSS